jgi:hypothetical protein
MVLGGGVLAVAYHAASAQEGVVWIAPLIPPEVGRLSIDNLWFAGTRLSIETDGTHTDIQGVPPALRVVDSPRPSSDG